MPFAQLTIGDLVIVRPGAAIPADGEVVEGASDVDESLLTGEADPVRKELGSTVVGGGIASGGLTVVKATKVG